MEEFSTEYKILYPCAAVVHFFLVIIFLLYGVNDLAVWHMCAVLFYAVGSLYIPSTKHKIRWIYMLNLEMMVTVALGNLVLGRSFGFTYLGYMTVPMTFYYLYSNRRMGKTVKHCIVMTTVMLMVTILTCTPGFKNRTFHDIPLAIEALLYFFNMTLCGFTLLITSCNFVLTIHREKRNLMKQSEEMEYISNYDELTGVYNRHGFYTKAKLFLEEHEDEKYCMLLSDVYNFRLLNEIMGVTAGDNLLKDHAEWLKAQMTGNSVLGRLQADRFAWLIPRERMSEELFEELLMYLRSKYSTQNFRLHMYLGVCNVENNGEPLWQVVDKCNQAILRVKGNLDQMVVYSEGQDFLEGRNKQELMAAFEEAIEKKDLKLYLQPQTDKDGNLYGAEALVRWEHPKKGLLMPGSFIDLFEQTGLIHKLDCYIWEEAAKKISEWEKAGYDYYISVNASVKDFFRLDVLTTLQSIVDKYQIAPSKLHIEITETALSDDVLRMEHTIEQLHDKGFMIEIDDFGSGYSSLNFLKDVCADVIKLDRMFLRETADEKRGKSILKSIISLAKDIDMHVIAEGTETKDQVDELSAMGCDRFQGYYFSKPEPVEKFEKKYNIVVNS